MPTFGMPDHPGPSSERMSRRMSGQARRDTQPELAVRRALHAAGLRYRVAYPVPGLPRRTIDIAFPRRRVAVFIDGCFWHGCPAHGTDPASNSAWWAKKILTNQQRDADTTTQLQTLGWTVVRFWEHEDPDAILREVEALVHRAEPGRNKSSQ
jgi:DNA mismatch endonuclease (patch repair protein)